MFAYYLQEHGVHPQSDELHVLLALLRDDNVLLDPLLVIFTSALPVVFAVADRDVSLEAMMSNTELFDMDGRRD